MLKNILPPDFINAILRASTPILFATLASAIASKPGITNMALEGMLLFSGAVWRYFQFADAQLSRRTSDYNGDRRTYRFLPRILYPAAENG